MSIGNGTSDPNIVSDYKGFTQTRTDQSLNTQITYQSTKEKLQSAMTSTFKVGYNDPTYGRIDKLNLTQQGGPFWNLVVEYNQPLSSGIIITTGNNDDKKATQNSLTVRMLSLAIQSHPNYKYIWNHSLATCYPSHQIDYADISGLNCQEAQDFLSGHTSGGFCYVKWIQNDSELPSQPVVFQSGEEEFKEAWRVEFYMTKPGVTCYDFPTYSITENARHKTRQNAAWSLAVKNGKLKFPAYGDFGLQKNFYPTGPTSGYYHWLCLGGGVNFDGKYWIANCTYQWSPDPEGWDLQLYEVAGDGTSGSNGYGWNNKSNNSILG